MTYWSLASRDGASRSRERSFPITLKQQLRGDFFEKCSDWQLQNEA